MPPADARPADLKRRSVPLMIVLTVATLGLYYPIWFLRRRAALNRLDAPRKLQAWPFILFLAFHAIGIGFAFATDSASAEPARKEVSDRVLDIAQLAMAVLMVVQCVFVRDILEDHLAGPGDHASSSILSDSVKPSAMMTLFFGAFYLQHVINRHVAGAAQSPST